MFVVTASVITEGSDPVAVIVAKASVSPPSAVGVSEKEVEVAVVTFPLVFTWEVESAS